MKAKALRLLVLAAVCTAALWTPAVSWAYEVCPSEYCGFWRNICERNTGTFVQTSVGYCEGENGNPVVLFEGVCTYTWRGPWTISCTGV